ncbi:hypothetical protein GGF46_003679 [Coemansia sp. RSA 552]|nr:hypothetical protein GGF46_003679 [Coemansia sp. RSA 552]
MPDNEELRRQIQALESAIRFRKQYQRPSSPRFNPLRPPAHHGRPQIRPSRNMKLTVAGRQSGIEAGAGESAQYVSYANKLVRVGSGSGPVRPQYPPRPAPRAPHGGSRAFQTREVTIDGERFVRRGRGNKLVRASTAPAPEGQQPMVSIDGESYVRTKKGSLVRIGALRVLNQRRQRPQQQRRRPQRQRRRLCTKHLFGRCELSSSECQYSHVLSPEVVPVCLHFQSDRCTKADCPFTHVKNNPNAPICRDFVYQGYCAKGAGCSHRHVYECPDWVEKGKCAKTKCRLPHPVRKDSPDAGGPTAEEEAAFMRQYIQRPVFGTDAGDEVQISPAASGSESDSDSEEELASDVSDDEAEELLKWYDDNYTG